ncbi:MAG: NAD(P)-dependent oxidoreductase [Thermoanaerobaculia bacterium]
MRVLVTGGTGFIGAHLVETLVDRGDEVTALVRSPHKATRLVELGVRTVRGDLEDLPALEQACEGQDVVYHLAGLVRARNQAEFLRINQGGTRNLLVAAQRQGSPRFIQLSSMAAGGPSAPGRPHTGEETPRPISAYGRSKLAGERVVSEGELPWTILRPPLVYGPGDTEILRAFKAAALLGLAPTLGSGEQELSALFAPDLADALVAAGSGETEGKTYPVCHPEIFTSREMARAVGEAVGRSVRIVNIPAAVTRGLLTVIGVSARAVGRPTLLDSSKADELLAPAWTGDPGAFTRDTGWQATHDLQDGLGRTVAWYREQGWLPR